MLESVTLILSAQKPQGGVGRVEVGDAVFWVFWCWFVGCLVVEGVVLALGVWDFGLEAMTDSRHNFTQQLLTKNSITNTSQQYKGKHTFYSAHIQISAEVNGWISLDRS